MKNRRKLTSILATGVLVVTSAVSCSEDFLNRPPLGAISEASLANEAGVNGSLIQTYRTLRGSNVANWYTSGWNWVWGSVRSDEAYKGSESSDQNQINPIERFEVLPGNPSVLDKWRACYDGVGMANTTLRLLKASTTIAPDAALQIEAETRFIRAFHHFEAKKTFNKAPYVGEDVVTGPQFRELKNDADIYPQIEDDFKFAYDNLTETKVQKGRVNKWAAGAYLAKVYLYQKKYALAKEVFDDVIADGKTSSGADYALLPRFSQVFRGANEHSAEVIFSVEVTVGDGLTGANGNVEMELPNPHNDGPAGCCGFFQPSQTLVNNYKTSGGLPVANPNASNVLNQENAPATFPDRGIFDPRLDNTVGRVGIQYLDWGLAKASWVRNLPNGGPWLPKKHNHTSAENGAYQTPGGWGQGISGRNILLMRFADVLLMAAEAEIEAGTLEQARTYINMVRTRAANAADFVNVGGVNEADYQISNYTVAFADKAAANQAVRTERLLELAMEGHRYYDLTRWGILAPTMTEFITREKATRQHLDGAVFNDPVDTYLPIPEYVIAQSGGNLTQN
jgi:hypothetical protein